MAASGNIKINSKAFNVTKLLNTAVSNPTVVLSLVSNLYSGNLQLPALGLYTSALKAIIKDVEISGTFAELNLQVFSETHLVTRAIIPTNQIVVPKSSTSNLSGLGGV